MPHTTRVSPYNYTFDPNGGSAAACLSRMVGDSRRVLEIGCGYGVISRQLAEAQHCTVVGVEYDPDSAEHARPWLQQLVVGDLEQPDWCKEISGKFDVVLAADVLEHLREPRKLLIQLRSMLHDEGELLVSIPNIGHAGPIAELLDGRFTYRPTGLLDETHLRFFTWRSFEALLNECGFEVSARKTVNSPAAIGQFAESWSRLAPVLKAILSGHPTAKVFQYVLSARVCTRPQPWPSPDDAALQEWRENVASRAGINALVRVLADPTSAVMRTCLHSDWYRTHNADVFAAGVDPFEHWIKFGADEGRELSANPLVLLADLLQERLKSHPPSQPARAKVSARIFQLRPAETAQREYDHGFLPLTVTSEDGHLREYLSIRQYLLSTPLETETYYGFLPADFHATTGLDSASVQEFIHQHNDHADVIALSPFFEQTALTLNVVERAIATHGNADAFTRCAALVAPGFRSQRDAMTSTNTIHRNCFVAKREFWHEWLRQSEKLLRTVEDNAVHSAANQPRDTPTSPISALAIELVASLLLQSQPQWSVKCLHPLARATIGDLQPDYIVLDALKIAYSSTGSQWYLQLYLQLRQRLLSRLAPTHRPEVSQPEVAAAGAPL